MAQRRFKLDHPLSFEQALRKVVSVPAEELNRREDADRQAREDRKAAREQLMARRAVGRTRRTRPTAAATK